MKRLKRKVDITNNVDTEGSWAVSYGDMVTLLLAFFILFFSMSQKQIEAKAIQKSLLASLANLTQKVEVPKYTSHEGEQDKRHDRLLEVEVFNKYGARTDKLGTYIFIEFPGMSFFDSGKTVINTNSKEILTEFAKL